MALEAKTSPHNLVWIDLEMSGLNPAADVILEIAVIITDNNLIPLDPGLSLIIHHDKTVLQAMNPWCQSHHGASGLINASLATTLTLAQAEQQVYAYITARCSPQSAPLCGNSVYQDKAFLSRWMPTLTAYLHYRLIDVSSIKELVKRWYPQNSAAHVTKKETHRALADIQESINELRHYQEHFFRK